MNTKTILSVTCITLGSAALFALEANGKGKAPAAAPAPATAAAAELDERVRMGNLITAKRFCVALRRNNAEVIRSLIDPRFLERHGDSKIATAPVLNIHNIQVAADGNTVLCLYETADSKKEAMVLRTAEFEGEVYVVPHGAPAPETGEILPWILRTGLDGFVGK